MTSHGHGHGHGAVDLPPAEARRARILLTSIVVPLLLATIVGIVLLWPRTDTQVGSIPMTAPGVTFERASVTDVPLTPGAEVLAELRTGEGSGVAVAVSVPPDIVDAGIPVGSTMIVMFNAEGIDGSAAYSFIDYDRQVPILWLAIAYVALVALVARWRGLAAVVGLAGSLAIIGLFVLPALMAGVSPLWVALVGGSAMMFVSVYLAHGISIRTTTALLGTFVGVAATTALSVLSARGALLHGTASEEGYQVMTTFPEVNMRALLVCGFVIASLGALNDVTITQASAVWELHASDPSVPRYRVFLRAMRIGRDHIASTVYTLAFAYVGTALPMLMIASIYDRAPLDLITSETIGEEIVRTLVSSIGLVLAIPVTTAIAAALVRTGREGSFVARLRRGGVAVPVLAETPAAEGPSVTVATAPATGVSAGAPSSGGQASVAGSQPSPGSEGQGAPGLGEHESPRVDERTVRPPSVPPVGGEDTESLGRPVRRRDLRPRAGE